MSENFYLGIGITLLVLTAFIWYWRTKESALGSVTHKSDQSNIPAEKNQKNKYFITIALALLVAGLVSFFVFEGGETSDDSGFLVFLPIWIAMWVPLNKKCCGKLQSRKKALVFVLVGLVIAFLIGIVVFKKYQ